MWAYVCIPQVSRCVTQPVSFLGVPKKGQNSSVPLGFFKSQRHKRKTYYPLPLPTRAAKSTYFLKGFGFLCFCLLWICDPAGAGVSTCLCPHVTATSVLPHPCQFSASPALLPTRSCQLFQPLLVKGSPLSSLWCS